MIGDVIKLIDSFTGELVSYSPVQDTGLAVDGVIVRIKAGILYKRNYVGPINVGWFGAVADEATDNTPLVQKAIDALGPEGGEVEIPEKVYFNLDNLVFPMKCNLIYYKNSDRSRPSYNSGVTNEKVFFSANANPSGIVNENQFSAAFHPGYVIDVRDDTPGQDAWLGTTQTRTDPSRASYNIRRQGMNTFRLVYQHSSKYDRLDGGVTFQPWCNQILIEGVGQNSFSNTINKGDIVKGSQSLAYGSVISSTPTTITLMWGGGKFSTGENIIINDITSVSNITKITLFVNTALQPLSVDELTGNWSIGLPPALGKDTFTVAGGMTLAPTITFGQYIPETIASPRLRFIDNTGVGLAVNGLKIEYDTNLPITQRRLTLSKLQSDDKIAHIGAVGAYISFSDTALVGTSSFNIQSITKNSDGDYTIFFKVPFVRADYTVSTSTSDPMLYPTIFAKSKESVRVRVFTTGTSNLTIATLPIGIIICGGDI